MILHFIVCSEGILYASFRIVKDIQLAIEFLHCLDKIHISELTCPAELREPQHLQAHHLGQHLHQKLSLLAGEMRLEVQDSLRNQTKVKLLLQD